MHSMNEVCAEGVLAPPAPAAPRPRPGRPRPRAFAVVVWALGAILWAGTSAPRAHAATQLPLARFAPVGAGVLPPSEFGATVAYLAAPCVGDHNGPYDRPGDVLLVGAPEDAAIGYRRGAVHVFVRRGSAFDRESHLLPSRSLSDPALLSAAEQFGASLAVLEDELVAIGAPGRDVLEPAGGLRAGAADRGPGIVAGAGGVSLVTRTFLGARGSGGAWSATAILADPAPVPGGRFGASVALGRTESGAARRIAVGAPGVEVAGRPLAGRVCVFLEGPGGWTPSLTLEPPTPYVAGHFGGSVAWLEWERDGAREVALAVSAPGDGGAGPGAGCVYVFDLQGALLARRHATPEVDRGQPHGVRYGEALAALPRGRLAIAAPPRGAVEVVDFSGDLAAREVLFLAPPIIGFGAALAAAGETLAIGAPFAGPGAECARAVPVLAPAQAPAAGNPTLLGGGRYWLARRLGPNVTEAVKLGATDNSAAIHPVGHGARGAVFTPSDLDRGVVWADTVAWHVGQAEALAPLASAPGAASNSGANSASVSQMSGGPGQLPRELALEYGRALTLARGGSLCVITAPRSPFPPLGHTQHEGGEALLVAAQPPARRFCTEGARGWLEAFGSGSLQRARLELVVAGARVGDTGILFAAPWAGVSTKPGCGDLGLPLPSHGAVRLGAATVDGEGRWQFEVGEHLSELDRLGLGSAWAFQVAWRSGGHASGIALELAP